MVEEKKRNDPEWNKLVFGEKFKVNEIIRSGEVTDLNGAYYPLKKHYTQFLTEFISHQKINLFKCAVLRTYHK